MSARGRHERQVRAYQEPGSELAQQSDDEVSRLLFECKRSVSSEGWIPSSILVLSFVIRKLIATASLTRGGREGAGRQAHQ